MTTGLIIDTDTHITEPADLWTSRLPAAWGDLVMHVRWDDARQAEAVAAAEAEIDAAWDAAEATGVAPDHFFEHVYAEPTPRMVTQRAELRARLGLGGPEA